MSVLTTALTQVKNSERYRKGLLASSKVLAPVNKIAHRHGPEILTGVGIVGGITAAVLGARATLRLEPVIDEMRENLSNVKELKRLSVEVAEVDEYTPQDIARDRTAAYAKGTIQIVKLYAPAVSLGIASITCVLAAHGIMRRRNVALAAAYSAVEKSFSAYRKRVSDELGEEKDRDFARGFTEVEKTDKKTGEKTTVTTSDPNGISQYARFFDEGSSSWSKTPDYNLFFLKSQQNYFNDKLQSYGYVFLNEVYEALGLPRTQAGAVVGWILQKGNDNYVDFGIYDFDNDRKRQFVNGKERAILLDFNVDGVIFDKI